MNKILAVADIHINDYNSRNPENRYRLYQGSRTVAQNIIDVGQQEGCDYIVLAGDIIEKCVVRPYVQAEVKLFLDTIMQHFKEGYIIWGNHDLDGKSPDQDITDACLGVMLPSNLHYAHQQIIKIGKETIGFCNWMPKFDLTWIPDKVDYLFTHATINYSPDSTDFIESQKLDETKFDLAFCGDIHRMAALGKYVSIGIPQKCKLGDSDDASGIVLDCDNDQWKWVNLNPHDNLMKFVVTDDVTLQDKWDKSTLTWYVYKSADSGLLGNDGNVKINTWDEVESLITDAVVSLNLQEIHGEIMAGIKDIDEGEVDFDFVLHKLHCENWRSIEQATVDFRRGDKIFLQGSNGSGKSSLLSALKYAFLDCSKTVGLQSLKPFVQFGAKNCLTEVEFSYQGNEYKLRRGTKEFGLWINGEEQKFPDKRYFEKEVRDRFPFINYLDDALFFDADHHRFIGGMSPERRTEVISKFLKLDRIDTLNDASTAKLDEEKAEMQKWEAKYNEEEKVLNYIRERISMITLPNITKTELEGMKQEGLEIQRKNSLWNQYINKTSRLQAQIQSYQDRINELEVKKSSQRDPSVIDYEIGAINTEIQSLNTSLVSLGNIRVNLEYKLRERASLAAEGNKAWTEANEIGIGKICSHCGQEIKTTKALDAHKAELLKRVEELRPQIAAIDQEIQVLTAQRDNSASEYDRINSDIAKYNSEISKRMSEKSDIASTQSELERYRSLLSSSQSELASLGVVERVDLPDNFMERMGSIESGISAWNTYETNKADETKKAEEMNYLYTEITKKQAYCDELERYVKLTGPTGIIYEEIMNRLCASWSDSNIKYDVVRSGNGKREHLSLMPSYNKSGNFVSYGASSSGEKTIMDIALLDKLISSAGLIVLDETLKNLDSSRLEEICEILRGMNVGCLILTSHADSIGAFYNKSISLSLNDSGLTELTVVQ